MAAPVWCYRATTAACKAVCCKLMGTSDIYTSFRLCFLGRENSAVVCKLLRRTLVRIQMFAQVKKTKQKKTLKFFGELMEGAGGSPASTLCFLPHGCLQGHGHYDPHWQFRLHKDLEAAFTSTAHRVCSNALLFRFINNRGGERWVETLTSLRKTHR